MWACVVSGLFVAVAQEVLPARAAAPALNEVALRSANAGAALLSGILVDIGGWSLVLRVAALCAAAALLILPALLAGPGRGPGTANSRSVCGNDREESEQGRG